MRNLVNSVVRRHSPELIAALAPILVFWRLIVGDQVLYWGLPVLQFVPWRVLVNQALRQGHLPLWTPLLGMGAPLMANHQSAALYPPNWISLILPPEVAIGVLAVLHLSFAGVGMVRVARRIGLNEFGSAVTGLTFSLCGYLTGRMWFITINNAIAWLPWIVLCSPVPAGEEQGVGQKPQTIKRLLILSALLSLQLLSGHAQSTFYTLLLAGAWVAWHSLIPVSLTRRPSDSNLQSPTSNLQPPTPNPRPLLSNLGFFALAVLFSFCLTAIQLIPTYELLSQSPRSGAAALDFATTFSLWPWRLLTFVVPNLFGHPADHNYWGYASYWEDNAYMSLLPFAFASYAIFRLRTRAGRSEDTHPDSVFSVNSVVIFAIVAVIVSIVLSLGKNTPIFPFFYHYIPGFGLFQAPARMLIWYTFAFSLLAGIGAHGWHASERKRYWSRLGIAGSLAMLVLGLAGAITIADAHLRTFGSALAWTAALAVVMFLILLKQPQSPARWNWFALAFVTADLGLAGLRATPVAGRTLYQLSPTFTLAEGRIFQFADDEYQVKFRDFFRFESFDSIDPQALRDSLLPNLPLLSGIASANDFDPLLPSRYVDYVEAMELSPQLMDLAHVKAIVKPNGVVSARPEQTARLRIVYDARAVDDRDAALAAVTSPTFDPDSQVILETGSSEPFPALALDPNRYSATVTLDRPGYVVLSDTYYPGWRAYVDGSPRPLLIADYNFRAVAVSPGTHTVTFEYAPFSVTLGLIVSMCSAMLWSGLFIAARK